MEKQENLHREKHKMSISFFFLSLGLLITLVTSVVSLLNLFFGTLDKKFPDVLSATYQYGYSFYDYEGIRTALAILIIFFPVFLIISNFWRKFIKKGISLKDEIVRKWMIYLILFVCALASVIDLVTLVKYFISGEITTRFILKVLAVLVVAAYIGVYFIFELKGKRKFWGFPIGWSAAIKSSALVILAIWFSFAVMGSPGRQRDLQFDEIRVQDLQNIQFQVIEYWRQKEKLPEKLTDLVNPISGYSLPLDREFEKGNTYEYNILDAKELKFNLCATFSLPMPKGWREYSSGGVVPMMAGGETRDIAVSYPYPGPGGTNESWDHQVGRTCFERTIDRDIFPLYPKPVKQ